MTICNEFMQLARLLADDGGPMLEDAFDAHRATCPTCQANERAAREQYTRKPANWTTIAVRPPCPGGHPWRDYGGIWFCAECGTVKP